MKTIVIAVVVMLTSISTDRLTGRWESKPSVKGNVTGIIFKPDSSFEGYVNKKPFVSGTYSLQGEVFSFVDNGCDGKRGIYKLIFFSNADSLKWELIRDSCKERSEGMQRLVVGRVK